MKAVTENKNVQNLVMIPLGQILLHEEIEKTSRPIDKAWVASLTDNIASVGLDVPLIVWEDKSTKVEVEDGGQKKEIRSSFLVAGHHRREAIIKLQKSKPELYKKWFSAGVPCIYRGGTLKEVLCAQLRENSARKDPTAAEMLPLMLRLRSDFSMKNIAIAAIIGRSPSYVSQVFDIESELGDEGVKTVVEGNVSAKDAMKAAKKVKDAKKAGKEVDVKEAIEEAKASTGELKDKGRARAEKKVSLQKLWTAYKALPSMGIGKKYELLEKLIRYSVGELSTLPQELRPETEKKASK